MMTPAEISVLGSILLNNDALAVCESANLSSFDFSEKRGEILYQAMRDLSADNTAIDYTTLIPALESKGSLDVVGGREWLSTLIDAVPAAVNVKHYARIVLEESTKRKLSALGQRIAQEGVGPHHSSETIASAAAALESLRCKANRSEPAVIGDIMARPTTAAKHIPTNLRALDAFTGGPALGEFWVIGAWSGHGKSALQGHMALSAALQEEPVLMFSVEMPQTAVKNRLLANVANVSVGRLMRNHISSSDRSKLDTHSHKLASSPLYIHDGPISVDGILSISRQMIERKGVKMILVDYVQLVSSSGENRRLQVETVATKLLSLAVQSKVSVIAASQLRKKNDVRSSAEPNMHDLRESAALFETPHVVALLHRPDIGEYDMDHKMSLDTTAVINIDKNRNGRTGRAKVAWDGPCLRFANLQPEERT